MRQIPPALNRLADHDTGLQHSRRRLLVAGRLTIGQSLVTAMVTLVVESTLLVTNASCCLITTRDAPSPHYDRRVVADDLVNLVVDLVAQVEQATGLFLGAVAVVVRVGCGDVNRRVYLRQLEATAELALVDECRVGVEIALLLLVELGKDGGVVEVGEGVLGGELEGNDDLWRWWRWGRGRR